MGYRTVGSFPGRRFAQGAVALILVAVAVMNLTGIASASPGSQKWLRHYNGPAGQADGAFSIAVSPDGTRVFVTGSSPGPGTGTDYSTVAYNASTGAPLWVHRYNGPINGTDVATSLAVGPNGSRVFVTGHSQGPGGDFDYATVAYNAGSGAEIWKKRYNGPGTGADYGASIAASPNGMRVFVTGYSAGSGTGGDYATVAYRASDGAFQWAKRYNGPASGEDYAFSVTASPNSAGVFVTGQSEGSGTGNDFATLAYAATTGAVQWLKRYDGPAHGNDGGAAIAASGSKVFVTGSSVGLKNNNEDYATLAYQASNGASAWVKRYDGPGDGYDAADSIAVRPNGSQVFVTGYSTGVGGDGDYATLGYTASTGAPTWLKRYDGPAGAHDGANAIAVSPNGTRVFVTGGSPGAGINFDYATISYNLSTGVTLWVSRYDGPGHGDDNARSIAVSPNGTRVFVTGEDQGSSTLTDYATLAYEV
jgi:WD40 repeat protein